MPVAAAEESQVYQDRNEQPKKIDSLGRYMVVDHESVYERSQRHEDKAQHQDEQAMIGPLQEVCEEIQKHQGHARKQEEQRQQQTRHLINVLSTWTLSHWLCFAISPKPAFLGITMEPAQPKGSLSASQERQEEFWAEMIKGV
jgi:hypothetical protein